MRILDSARKHGIADQDQFHAARFPVKDWPLEDDAIMRVGTSRSGALLELGIDGIDGDSPVIFHAMKCSTKYNPYL